MDKKMKKAVRKYMRLVGCNVRQTKIAVYYNKLMNGLIAKAMICPECGNKSLYRESTDYEYTHNEEWVECSECDYTAEIEKHEAFQPWYGFDELLFMCDSIQNYGSQKRLGKSK